jgi:hypothetical protein
VKCQGGYKETMRKGKGKHGDVSKRNAASRSTLGRDKFKAYRSSDV